MISGFPRREATMMEETLDKRKVKVPVMKEGNKDGSAGSMVPRERGRVGISISTRTSPGALSVSIRLVFVLIATILLTQIIASLLLYTLPIPSTLSDTSLSDTPHILTAMAPIAKFIAGLSSLLSLSSALPPTPRAVVPDKSVYTERVITGINALQSWYDDNGLWSTTGWWNSGNCLQVLADFSSIDPTSASTLSLPGVMINTFTRAQAIAAPVAAKTLDLNHNSLMHASYRFASDEGNDTDPSTGALVVREDGFDGSGFPGFLNNFYDDEGWWALALIRSYDVLGQISFLEKAEHIFEDMRTGANTPCGGIYWAKHKDYVNAIANELYLAVAASLANRVPDRGDYYRTIAAEQWQWLEDSGMRNGKAVYNDGLDEECNNNGRPVWSYNQGVVLGGLVELAKASPEHAGELLDTAHEIARGAIGVLTEDNNGILKERACEPECGGDGPQFKGVFVRNLRYLYEVTGKSEYRDFILRNADSIWDNARKGGEFGLVWGGPFDKGDAARQSSALDALVAAVAVV